MLVLDIVITAFEALKPFTKCSFTKSSFPQLKEENQNYPQMTRIWLGYWYFRWRINLWCKYKFTKVVVSSCWQISKLPVWHFWSAYFDQHLPLQPSIEKWQKQSCTPNILYCITYICFRLAWNLHFQSLTELASTDCGLTLFAFLWLIFPYI